MPATPRPASTRKTCWPPVWALGVLPESVTPADTEVDVVAPGVVALGVPAPTVVALGVPAPMVVALGAPLPAALVEGEVTVVTEPGVDVAVGL